ncbi:MAG: TRAP transporter large permease [Rhodobacter sp.]|nr:TRAP transporter large permease [Paracoccaceae bacterium]MCC0077276.1 TRAP transporter large permease [Rhodobacter sp.]
MEVFFGIVILLGLIVFGMPVGFALGVAGVLSLMMLVPTAMIYGLMAQVVHHTVANYVILTIPMFVLISEVLAASGIAQDLMVACNRAMRRIRGGLAMACVLAGSILAAASGSSTASVATLSRAAYPTMKKLGYDTGFSVATISMAGTLAIMIPPSIAFVVYGIITEESIGRLFMAGLVPGLLTAVGYIVTIAVAVRFFPHLAPAVQERAASVALTGLEQTGRVWPVVLLVVGIMAALYSGVATPTEIGALGALGAILICVALRRITTRNFTTAVANTLRTSTMIVTIIFGALMFGYFMSLTQMTGAMLAWIEASGLSPTTVLLLVVVFYLILGMFMDQFAIIVLTVPISYALITGLGYNGIWFGVLMVKTAEIGLITPPLGLNIFIASASTGVTTRKGFGGVVYFLIAEFLVLGIIIAFPDLILLLPDLMRGAQ